MTLHIRGTKETMYPVNHRLVEHKVIKSSRKDIEASIIKDDSMLHKPPIYTEVNAVFYSNTESIVYFLRSCYNPMG